MYVYPVLAVLNYQVDLMDRQWSEVKGLPEACVAVPDILSRRLADPLLVYYVPPDINLPAIELYDTGVVNRGVQQEVGRDRSLIAG